MNRDKSKINLVMWDWSGTIRLRTREGAPVANPIALQWLEIFARNKCIQWVVSNESSPEHLADEIRLLKLQPVFLDRVICAGNGHNPKPQKDMYDLIIDKFESLNVQVESPIFIGDTLTDREFAEAIGARFVHIWDLMHFEI
jgi:FMN phosphatase YigB (HAD superfamily)